MRAEYGFQVEWSGFACFFTNAVMFPGEHEFGHITCTKPAPFLIIQSAQTTSIVPQLSNSTTAKLIVLSKLSLGTRRRFCKINKFS